MLKNKIWLGIILSIILLLFSINGFTAYYKYTQESGANFYVGTGDKADALEDTNEMRQIIDDLGALLDHSKRDDVYPKTGPFGGTLAIPNSALVSFATGTKGDLFYCSADNVWIKLNIGTDNQILVVATDALNFETASSALLSDVDIIAMLDEAETILANWVNTAHPWADNEVADNITCSNYYLKTEIDTLGEVETIYAANIIDNTELASALGAYYLKTAIDTIGEVETIWGKNITDSDELASALALYYLKTAIDTQEEVEAIWEVSLVNDGDLDLYYLKTAIDTQGEIEAIWGVSLVNDGDLDLYYLKTAIDTQGEMETIWGVALANDSELHTILTLGTANGLSLDNQELSLALNSDTSAGAVASGAGQNKKVWKTDTEGVPGWREDDTTALTTFLALTDVPASYTGHGGKIVRVAGAENALEFIAMPGGGDVLGPATSVDHSVARFNGTDNKTIQDSLMTINDDGSVNIPLGETYKINTVPLAYGNIVGAAGSGANTNITSLTGLTTPLGIAYGGTGSVSASGARTALGLVYGVNVQAYDATLLSLATLGTAADKIAYTTNVDTWAETPLTAFGRSILDDANEATFKATVNLEIGTDIQAYDAGLLSLAGLTYASPSFIKVTANDTYAIRTIAQTRNDLQNYIEYPQSYGSGTGTSGDPWTGLASAYTACPTGGTIYLRAGYYQLNAKLRLAKSINIVGEGMGKTIILTANDTGFDTWNTIHVTFKDLTIDGELQTTVDPKGNLVDFIGWDATEHFILVQNVELKNAQDCGINTYQINHSLFQNIYAHDNGEHGMHSTTEETTGNCHNGYRDIYAWDNVKSGFDDTGHETTPYASYNTYDNINCWGGGEFGMYLGNMNNITASNIFITDSGAIAEWADHYGLYIQKLGDSNISNVYVSYSEFQGIQILDSDNINLTNIISKNNNVRDDNFDEDPVYSSAGIAIKGSSGIYLNSCQFYDDGGTPTQRYGIELKADNTDIRLVNYVLAPNKIAETFGTTAGILIATDGVMDGTKAVAGDIQYFDGTNWVRLAKGTAGQVLEMNPGATAPEWDTDDTGGSTAWDDIGNPDAADEIDFGAYIIELNVEDFRVGDGGANYVKFGDAGAVTLIGTATIEGVDATEFGYLDGVTSDIQDQFGLRYLKTEIDTQGEMETIWGDTLMNDLVDDTTPELADDLDCNNKDLTEVKTIQFNGLHAIGNSGSTETIDWQNGMYQSITLDEACVISFSNEYVGTLNLMVTYGGSFALTFDGGVTLLEEGGIEIVTTDAIGVDLLIFKNLGVADTYIMGALLDVKD